MSNPNNCEICNHKKTPDGGWCYMFRDEPNEVCMKHTMRNNLIDAKTLNDAAELLEACIVWKQVSYHDSEPGDSHSYQCWQMAGHLRHAAQQVLTPNVMLDVKSET